MQLPPTSSMPSDTPRGGSNLNLMLLIGGGVVALILIAVGAMVLFGSFNQRPNTIPQILAGDTQMYAAITPNLSDLPNIDRLRKAFPELMDYQNDADFNEQLKEELGVTFNEDITPWLGTEMAFTISGIPYEEVFNQETLQSGSPPDIEDDIKVLLVLSARDVKAAQAFLDKQRTYREGQGDQFTSSTTEKVTIYTQEGEDIDPLSAFALVGDKVIFANDASLISAIVTRDPNGKDTLAANAQFQQVFAALPADRIGFIFVNGQPLGQALLANSDQFVADMSDAAAEQLLDQLDSLKAFQGVGFSISVLADGVAFDALSVFDRAGLSQATADQIKEAGDPVSPERVANVSGDALLALSFRLPTTFGEQIQTAIENDPMTAEQVVMMEEQLNISLQDDLLSWLQGEGTFVLLPGETIAGMPMPISGYFAFKSNDPAAAEAGMTKIIAAIDEMSGGELGLHDEDIGGVTWQAVGVGGETAGGYTFNNDELIIGIGVKTLEAAVDPATTIAENTAYQTGVKVIPNPNGGFIFVNLPAALSTAEEQMLISDEETMQRLEPFKAIVAGGAPGMSDKGVSYGRLFFVISAE